MDEKCLNKELQRQLDEGNPNETDGFKRRLRESIKEAIQNKFLADDSKYANGDDLANEQTCFYVIRQDDAYQPFSYLSVPESQVLSFRIKIMRMQFCLSFHFSGMEI